MKVLLNTVTCVTVICMLLKTSKAQLMDAMAVGIIDNDPMVINICDIALKDARAAGICSQAVMLYNGTGCDNSFKATGTANAGEMVYRKAIRALIADDCNVETMEIARLSYFWNIPIFLRSGNTLGIFNSALYPTSIQFDDTTAISLALTIKALAATLNQVEMVLVGPKQTNMKSVPLYVGIQDYLKQISTINITNVLAMEEANWSNMVSNIDKMKTKTKLIVIDGTFVELPRAVDKLNLASLGVDYIVVLICNNVAEYCAKSLKTASSTVLMLTPDYPNYALINAALANRTGANYNNDFFHEYYMTYVACYGVCVGVRQAGSMTGTSVANVFKSAQFTQFPYGPIEFDAAGIRLPQYSISWQHKNGTLLTVYMAYFTKATCTQNRCFEVSLTPVNDQAWSNSRNPNLDPCVYMGGCVNYVPYIIGGGVAIFIIAIMIMFFFYRRQRRLDAFRMHWKIARTSIKVIENKQSSVKGKGGNPDATTLSSKRRVIPAYAILETTKAEFIALKHMSHIRFGKDELNYIMDLKRINHDNLTNFIGICYNDGDKFYILHNLVERASLEDYVFDSDFKLDETFRSAFLRDILKGLAYLHKSPIGYHGLLSLSNCLIDANWVLKLTNFGVTKLLHNLIESNNLRVIENIPFELYYAIAPEHLQGVALGKSYPRGDHYGDLYSFGIILYQILFRIGPYEKTTYGHKELFHKIGNDNLRPLVEDFTPQEKTLVEIMEECWKSVPSQRPKVRAIAQVISAAFQSTKGNLVDQMIRMNEKHAQNLESIVAERGAMLVEAQEQTDRLLCEILPPSIAQKLKTGEVIEPRSYEAATVLFCQLVDFMFILTNTKPDQVVTFLNDVFTMFDQIIGRHDAYKVETTGETYMVASGVPNENENRHVFEISEIALEFRDASYTYTVGSLPKWKLQIRIGYHCGPIAAGVIGLKAPRFCLFGDTVNFASRMQSNCPPNQIQMSETTAKQLMEVNEYKLTKRGIVHVKGKGDVNTYWLNEHIHEPHDNIAVHTPQYTAAVTGKPMTAASNPSTIIANSTDRNNNVNSSNQKIHSTQSSAITTTSFSPINSELEPLIDPLEK